MLAYFGANIAQGLPSSALTVTFLATRLNTIAQDKTTALLQSAARRIESLALAARMKEQAPAP
ncbi:hypothetical protein [Achromobacter marplatensis]|uniref:hypothetical protein n=1 Tax=Achromobacter marplatensis TaxID=470868 RepID=UPI0039F655F5